MVARHAKADLGSSSVGAEVGIGPDNQGGFTLEVVVIPALPRDQAQALADRAHHICPYSNATRGNIDVTITDSDDGPRKPRIASCSRSAESVTCELEAHPNLTGGPLQPLKKTAL